VQLENDTRALFKRGTEIAAKQGLILVTPSMNLERPMERFI